MGALTLLITGAAGYIGRHAVAEARRRGHRVVAVVRDAQTAPHNWARDAAITVIACDLTTPDDALSAACTAADCVVHIAAAMSGKAEVLERDTLEATRQLLQVLPTDGKLVLLSSIAVYDIFEMSADDLLTEGSPVLTPESHADGYAHAKRAQERIVLSRQRENELALTILRAGAIFGPGHLWNSHLGVRLGPLLIRMESRGQLPLCHISTCASALVEAAERPATDPINVLDEDLPGRVRFLQNLARGPKLVVPINWRLVQIPARGLAAIGLRDRLPGILRSDILRTRFLPLRFDNSRMRRLLGMRQAHSFEALMHEAQS